MWPIDGYAFQWFELIRIKFTFHSKIKHMMMYLACCWSIQFFFCYLYQWKLNMLQLYYVMVFLHSFLIYFNFSIPFKTGLVCIIGLFYSIFSSVLRALLYNFFLKVQQSKGQVASWRETSNATAISWPTK